MSDCFIRTYRPYDLEDVRKHLIIAGDLSADCAACRALGLNAYEDKTCGECGTAFKYITSRRLDSHPGERFQFARRVRDKRPDLIMIDYGDFEKLMGQKKARDFFGTA